MKRFTLILAAIIGLATTMNAQAFFTTDISGCYFRYIPGAFSISGSPLLMTVYYDEDGQCFYSFYDKDFELVESLHVELVWGGGYAENLCSIYYIDMDNMAYGDRYGGFLFTQNLFNDDEYFEYMTYGAEEEYPFTCITIKSSNGNIIQTIRADEGFVLSDASECFMIRVDNQLYLLFNEYNEDIAASQKTLVYQINQSEGLTKVDVQLPISVFPTMPTREQQITVELGEGNNARVITVVNELGQVVKRVPVEEGQREVTIPARELNSGLNVVNTRTKQGQGSCKIIVQ